MSDVFALSAPLPATLTNPLRVAPYTAGERFDMQHEAEQATARSFPAERNYRLEFDRAAEAFRGAGVELENPWTDLASPYSSGTLNVLRGRASASVQAERDRRLAAWDDAAARLQAANPDAIDTYPNAAALRLAADARARDSYRRAQAAEDMGGGLGAFAGTVTGAMQDPVQALGLFVGAPWRAVTGSASLLREVGRVAVVDAAIGAGLQASVELSAAEYRAQIDAGEGAIGSILGAAIGSAVIGGGLRGIVGTFQLRGVRDRAAGPDATPADIRAADGMTLAEARLAEINGNPGGPERMAAHEAALDRATADTAAGRATGASVPQPAPDVPPGAARGYVERMLAGATAGDGAPAGRFNVFTPAGRAVVVEPQVVELDTLVPSHLDDGAMNPAYPHAEGVQPRDRGAAPSQDQIRAIAAGLIPERLGLNVEAGSGAPIVAQDLVVESGNGRVAALRRVFSDPTLAEVGAAYRAFLEAQGHDLSGMRQPVLVSRRVSALSAEERRAFVAEANGRATLAQGVGERARADAAQLDDALPLFRGGDIDSADNAGFVRAFLGRLPPEERGSLITKEGRLSAEGAARLRGAVLARAYGDEMGPLLDRLLEGQTDGLRAIAGALTDVSARWAQLRQAVAAGEVEAGMDATAELIGAVRMIDEARRLKMTVPELLLQTDLDRPPLTDTARAFLASFFGEANFAGRTQSRPNLAARLDGFVEEALKVRPGPDLFGGPPVAAADIVAGARMREAPAPAPRASPEAPPEAPRLDFADEAPDLLATRQRALREAAAAEETARPPPERLAPAELLEARRVAAERDVPVPDGEPSADGVQPTRGARSLLDEAEREAEEAAAGAVCLIGAAA